MIRLWCRPASVFPASSQIIRIDFLFFFMVDRRQRSLDSDTRQHQSPSVQPDTAKKKKLNTVHQRNFSLYTAKTFLSRSTEIYIHIIVQGLSLRNVYTEFLKFSYPIRIKLTTDQSYLFERLSQLTLNLYR